MVSGFVICGFGFGGFFFGIISKHLCNPDNLRPIQTETSNGLENLFGPEVSARVPSMIRNLCLIWISLFVIGLLTITKYKQHNEQDVNESLSFEQEPRSEEEK